MDNGKTRPLLLYRIIVLGLLISNAVLAYVAMMNSQTAATIALAATEGATSAAKASYETLEACSR